MIGWIGWHEATWRRFLRVAFIGLAFLPTLAVVGWALVRSTPQYVASWETTLRQSLGVVVRLDGVTHVRPGVIRFHQLQLLDPDTHERIATVPDMEMIRQAKGWRCHAPLVLASHAHAGRLWHLLADRLLRYDLLGGAPFSWHIDQWQFARDTQGDPPLVVAHLTGQLATSPAMRRVEFDFQCDPRLSQTAEVTAQQTVPQETTARASGRDTSLSPSVHLAIERPFASTTDELHIDIDTRQTDIALAPWCALMGIPVAAELRARGTWHVDLQTATWKSRFQGSIENVDLAALTAEFLPNRLEGIGRIEVERALFGSDGMQRLVARIDGAELAVDRAVLESFVQQKLAKPGAAYESSILATRYSPVEVSWSLSLDPSGLRCWGSVGAAESHVIAQSLEGPLLTSDPQEHQRNGVHIERLIRALLQSPELPRDQKYQLASRWYRWLPPTLPRLESGKRTP